MLENFMLVGQHVLILFILIAIGAITEKTHILDQNAINKLTNFVLIFVTPCIIIQSFQRKLDQSMIKGLGIVFGVAILIHIISILLAKLCVKDKDEDKSRVLIFSVIFSNCGFMSLPLEYVLLGDDGVFYGSVYIAAFNVVVWSYGLALMGGGVKEISAKKLVVNPGIIGVLIGVILAAFSIQLPEVVLTPVNYIASLNTPLPMIIIGFYIAKLDFRNLMKGIKGYVAILLRLVVMPLITLGLLLLFNVKGTLLMVCVIASSAPTAAITVMFSNKYKRDTELAAQLISLSTIFSLITMPVIIGLAQYYS